ncbi:MAG: tyrosine-type recombinase/integrase [Candidatus Uhrbacteria bacterium]|nr:tyrosine-type recombinase/integrase [Candidatus Uhrbacteria bacterium]
MNGKNKSTRFFLPNSDDFYLSLQANNFSPETVYSYERDLEVFGNFLATDVGLIDFSDVTKKTIAQYKAYLSSRDRRTADGAVPRSPLSAFSINRHLSSLRCYLKYLLDNDYPTSVTCESVKLIKTDIKHPRVAELHELVRLIEAPSKLEKDARVALRNRTMLEVLFSTGMRISEIVGLNRTQIDESGRIFIRGKGKKERFVYLTPRAYGYIVQYLSTRGDTAEALFIPYRGRNADSPHKKISTNYVQSRIKWYREILRINVPITPHSLRHGFATYLAESGANPAAIQILLGHESLDTTTRYVHASDRYAEKTHQTYHPLKK